ncbi:MAG: YbhB/YbcL family Raf kinase inhibitor-like protein, partial [Desulfobacteraceae bacterium]|nr:YbhB/YbcL family Raf kinase inhibitor-like protein [Desulfobacteraceae bacterium]
MTLVLTSDAFANKEPIPAIYTCQGKDISPSLSWSGIPEKTKSLALIIHDPDVPSPDAPKRIWVHWVLLNIPKDTKGLAEDISQLPDGTLEGLSDWNKTGYGGPCPPMGRHRYFHKLYTLDIVIQGLQQPTKDQLEAAMKNHIIETAELVGTY